MHWTLKIDLWSKEGGPRPGFDMRARTLILRGAIVLMTLALAVGCDEEDPTTLDLWPGENHAILADPDSLSLGQGDTAFVVLTLPDGWEAWAWSMLPFRVTPCNVGTIRCDPETRSYRGLSIHGLDSLLYLHDPPRSTDTISLTTTVDAPFNDHRIRIFSNVDQDRTHTDQSFSISLVVVIVD